MAVSSFTSASNGEEGDEEYTYFYQKLKFRENVDDKIDAAHVRRVKLLLNHYESKR